MKYTELAVYTDSLGAEIVGGVLTAAGICCWSTEDPADLKELLQSGKVPYDYVDEALLANTGGQTVVKAYITRDAHGAKQLAEIRRGLADNCGAFRTEEREVDDADWADNWKKYFHPLPIGERFIVRPTWESCKPDGRIVLTIDPASSFGTGRHETTALCLRELEKLRLSGETVLDMGCGSGILAIGALKLGAKSAVLVDIDSAAAAAAGENTRQNGVAERVRVLCGSVLEDAAFAKTVFGEQYGVILANIVADTIIEMADMFHAALKEDGALVCSGIIESRREEVEKALARAGFALLRRETDNDWAAIVCVKRQGKQQKK